MSCRPNNAAVMSAASRRNPQVSGVTVTYVSGTTCASGSRLYSCSWTPNSDVWDADCDFYLLFRLDGADVVGYTQETPQTVPNMGGNKASQIGSTTGGSTKRISHYWELRWNGVAYQSGGGNLENGKFVSCL
jgi:hypothetical protein